jgi:beta-glucanase (GH16 family)
MVQTWNKFCFTNGYIEVSVTFPGPDENTAGYVSSLPSFSAPRRDTNPVIPALL